MAGFIGGFKQERAQGFAVGKFYFPACRFKAQGAAAGPKQFQVFMLAGGAVKGQRQGGPESFKGAGSPQAYRRSPQQAETTENKGQQFAQLPGETDYRGLAFFYFLIGKQLFYIPADVLGLVQSGNKTLQVQGFIFNRGAAENCGYWLINLKTLLLKQVSYIPEQRFHIRIIFKDISFSFGPWFYFPVLQIVAQGGVGFQRGKEGRGRGGTGFFESGAAGLILLPGREDGFIRVRSFKIGSDQRLFQFRCFILVVNQRHELFKVGRHVLNFIAGLGVG